jgi:hypothetical protein
MAAAAVAAAGVVAWQPAVIEMNARGEAVASRKR